MEAVPATNALTVDLEEYFQVSNFDQVISRDDWGSLPSRAPDHARRLMDCFEAESRRATFFTLGWVAERQPALLREIVDRGHEVACHGYGHELVYALGEERFRADLRRAKATLEDATGSAVLGYRAPSYSITMDSLWALRVLAEEGFEYDSSIFPIRHYRYGIPDFVRHPTRLDLGGGLSIDEFPLTTLQVRGVKLPVAGGAYLRFLPFSFFRWAFGRATSDGAPGVLYLHPWEIDPDQPRQEVSTLTRINHYYNLGGVERRVARLVQEFDFAPMADVLHTLETSMQLPTSALEEAVNATLHPSAAYAS
ncbi:MAG: XrtA system polysaccharide deacetylase [Myxococcota bacterium]